MSNKLDRFSAVGFLNRMALIALGTAIGGCGIFGSQPPPPAEDVLYAQSSSAAMIAFDHGDVETAAQLYQRALSRGHAMDNSQSVAEAAYNLAACEITLDRYDSALNHLQEAKYNSAKTGSNLDEIQLLSAKVAYLRERDADAQGMTEPLCKSDLPIIRLQAQSLLILIACDLGNMTDAQSKLKELRAMALKVPEASPAIKADVEKAEGTVAKLDQQMHAAAQHFDHETDLLRAAHRYRDVIHSLSRSGSAHNAAGEFGDAADRYYRAAMACAALQDQAKVKELAEKARAAAKAAGDKELASMINRLIDQASATTAP